MVGVGGCEIGIGNFMGFRFIGFVGIGGGVAVVIGVIGVIVGGVVGGG